MTNKKTDVWTLIDTKDMLTFEEFKEQLIHYKSSISWIDKYGNKHYMYGKDPILNDEGKWTLKWLQKYGEKMIRSVMIG